MRASDLELSDDLSAGFSYRMQNDTDLCTPTGRQAYSCNQRQHVIDSPEVVAMLPEQQKLLQEVLYTQQAMLRRQKEFDQKMVAVKQQVAKFFSSADSSTSGSPKGRNKYKVTRDLSVSLQLCMCKVV